MHILYLSQYYPPEMGAPSARVSELARIWSRQEGVKVSVLTGFPHHPVGRKRASDRWRLMRKERDGLIEVVRAYVFATPNRGVVRRVLSYCSFMLSSLIVGAVRIKRPSIVVATSPQPLSAVSGYLLARWFRVPFVFEVRDLWPESILAVGALQQGRAVRWMERLSRFLYRESDRIVTVGDGYKRLICASYDIPEHRISVVPNGVDLELFQTNNERVSQLRAELGWNDEFIVLYAGTMGMAHGLSVVLDAAAELVSHEDVRIVLVGEGAEKMALEERAQRRGLKNVEFFDQVQRTELVDYYASCNVGLVCLLGAPLFKTVLPSKLFEYLAMQKPVLFNVDGEVRRVVESGNAGIFVTPDSPRELAEGILHLKRNRELAGEMGRSGRRLVESNFDREKLGMSYLRLLFRMVQGPE